MKHRALFTALLLLSASSTAEAAVVTVTPASLAGWELDHGPRTCTGGFLTGSAAFVNGPATPPLGSGSVRVNVGSSAGSFVVNLNATFDGVLLRDITEMHFSTFVISARSHAASQQAPRLILSLDLNGDQTQFEQIVFIPRLQTGTHPGDPVPNQGPVVIGVWQTWDAVSGGWWDFSGSPSNPPLVKLSTMAAAHPSARLGQPFTPGLGVLAGCEAGDWTDFSGNFDNVSIGVRGAVTTYNFEPEYTIPAVQPFALLVIAAALLTIALVRLAHDHT